MILLISLKKPYVHGKIENVNKNELNVLSKKLKRYKKRINRNFNE